MANDKKSRKGAKDMLKNTEVRKNAQYTIDLAQTEGEGSFPCPKCGAMISPDDDSEETYKIVDTKMLNGELVGLVMSCCSCGTVIKLTGFQQAMEGLTSQ